MESIIYKSESRGRGDYGWLKTRYTFSFASYHDPLRVHFGALRVLNDDWIDGGKGFDTHPHDNMEIVTIMLQGELNHRDSMGHMEILKPNEVQVMTAGNGIFHSERNNLLDTPIKLFQIWIFPREQNLKPRYDQKWFDPEERNNKWQMLVAPDEEPALRINQDAWLSRAALQKGKQLTYDLHREKQGIFLFVIEGSITFGDEKLNMRDGAGIRDTKEITVVAKEDSDILLIEVPYS
ncbi:MAG: pirin family protein [Bacteroidales bacterium]|nr:pirin family protein [Bacteroidales bacterium]